MHVGQLLVTAWVLVHGWMLVAAAGRCCCWLLLVGWMLLVAPAVDCRCWLLLLVAGWLPVAAGILFAGGKVFEYFRDIDDLRLKQLCRRKTLWIFSGCWWFAAKICEKVFENFQDIDDLRLRQFCRRKSLCIFPGYWWKESGREFRFGEIDQLTECSGSQKWECAGYLYSAMAQSYHVTSHVIM